VKVAGPKVRRVDELEDEAIGLQSLAFRSQPRLVSVACMESEHQRVAVRMKDRREPAALNRHQPSQYAVGNHLTGIEGSIRQVGARMPDQSASAASGYPSLSQPSNPPSSGRTRTMPSRLSESAARALEASLGQVQ
jgi:hypothetical protein